MFFLFLCLKLINTTLWNSVLLCGEIHSKSYSNEDYDPIFLMVEVPIDGIVTVARCYILSFSEKNVPFPGEQHCFTCTCFTALHVYLKQRYTPRLYTLLYEREIYRYRRKKLMVMTNAIKLKTIRNKYL